MCCSFLLVVLVGCFMFLVVCCLLCVLFFVCVVCFLLCVLFFVVFFAAAVVVCADLEAEYLCQQTLRINSAPRTLDDPQLLANEGSQKVP